MLAVRVMVLLMTSDPRHLGNGGHVIVSTPVNAIMMPLQFSERRKLPESWALYIRITGLTPAPVARFLSLRSGL